MKPGRWVHDVVTKQAVYVEWTDEEWVEIQTKAAQIASEIAARPAVKTLEERIAALEAKFL